MKWIKIKDNQYINKSKVIDVGNVIDRVANKTLEKLENEGIFVFPEVLHDTKDMSKEQMIIQNYNEGYLSGNVMGYLGVGNEYLTIESRFSTGGNDYFFQYILNKVFDFPNFIDLMSSVGQDEKLFTLIMFLFPYYLKHALRKGVFKSYTCNKYNDENVKGRIDISRHIRKNTPFIGDVAYSRREYSFDNYLMELVRHTIEYIKSKSYGYKLLSKVKEEVKIIVNATSEYTYEKRNLVIEENSKNIIRHAYYHEYRMLQKLCLMILKVEKHSFYFGKQRIYGILFDGSWLFEEYINLIIGNKFYHPMNKSGLGRQYLFEGNIGMIYPDFISKDADNRIIADAKYKPVDNIGNKDFLQIIAYIMRFDSKKGIFIYPEIDDNSTLNLNLNSGLTYENNVMKREDTVIIKYGIKIPKYANSYIDFVEKIYLEEKELIEFI
jgi:conserved domain protein